MDYKKNNLSNASSPYLNQHAENPIWWQEWSEEVLEYARKENKILFVSVGYATCHWCHVMASEAFSNPEIADYLNRHFLAIKVDKEQRPDIDRYLMHIAVSLSGTGGWPLNAFLDPRLKPITVLTYVGIEPKFGMPGFLDILKRIKKFYSEQKDILQEYSIPTYDHVPTPESRISERIKEGADSIWGGFGKSTKFPPHAQLLFIFYYLDSFDNSEISEIAEKTLDMMYMRGLHDHLQGGFYRYCVDRTWTIPHFEKMLYDQAYLLWIYSLAYRVYSKESYAKTVKGITQCLEQTYLYDGLYYSAHDADTDHQEGNTYLWSQEELNKILNTHEYRAFAEKYDISKYGNFEEKNHLIKKNEIELEKIESKLLLVRKQRKQPFVDKKVITSFNCLLGIGFINAYRYIGEKSYLNKAQIIYRLLIDKHLKNGILAHSSVNGRLQYGKYLEDYASMLLFMTYLHEETRTLMKDITFMYEEMSVFEREDGTWLESFNNDFIPIPAEQNDYSIPSSASLAMLAKVRAEIFMGKDYIKNMPFYDPLEGAFANITTLIRNGYFHVLHSRQKKKWAKMPVNTIQIKESEEFVCHKGTCQKPALT